MLDRFSDRIEEMESVMRELAIDVTTGSFVDRLPPERVWERTEDRIELVSGLLRELREYLFILKPESVPSIQRRILSINEHLEVFKETLKREDDEGNVAYPESIDELRRALSELTGFLALCRDVRGSPSPVIKAILELKDGEDMDISTEIMAKMKLLENLIRSAQKSHIEASELDSMTTRQFETIRLELEKLSSRFRDETYERTQREKDQ
jgi:hypothetical protein